MAKNDSPSLKRGGRPRKRKKNIITDKVAIERAEKIGRILELRREGWTLQQIADVVKISVARVSIVIKEALERVQMGPAREIKGLELARLDELQTVFYPKALNNEPFAFEKVMSIMDRRAKLLGLNIAEQVVDPTENEEIGEELLKKLNDMAARKINARKQQAIADGQTIEGTMIDVTPAQSERGPS